MMSADEEGDCGILELNRPLNCGCQELISSSIVTHHGWLRKRSLRNKLRWKLLNWPRMYVVLADKNLYCFQNETSKKPTDAMNMYGFNRIIRAGENKQREAIWAFKLENVQTSVPSYYFAASSEKEMVKWMKLIKREMLIANGKQDRVTDDIQYGGSISDQSCTSSDYKFIEESIYETPEGAAAARPQSFIYNDAPFDEDSADETEHDVPITEAPRPLPLPPRESGHQKLIKEFKERKINKLDGYSLGQPVSPGPKRSAEEEYWASVHFDGNRVEASKTIERIAEEGVFLVRKSEDEQSRVLVVYTTTVKKYKIQKTGDGSLTLSLQNGPFFDNLEQLLYHYFTNTLPGTDHKLTVPFKRHVVD